MWWNRIRSAFVLAVSVALVAGGCSLIAPPPVNPGMLDLHVSNGTTLPVSVAVNGQAVGVAAPGQELVAASDTLPSMPWTVEALTPSGRLLTQMRAQRDQISSLDQGDGSTRSSGAGQRVDLSCGRLDLWVGVPMLGPMPGPGTPGDCDP